MRNHTHHCSIVNLWCHLSICTTFEDEFTGGLSKKDAGE